MAALFMRREEKLAAEQKEYLERLCASDAALEDARRLTQEFAEMVRNLEGLHLDRWLEEAENSEASDLAAVRGGLRSLGVTGRWKGSSTS